MQHKGGTMKDSNFQFSNPALVDLDFHINKDFQPNDDKPLNVNTSFNINISKQENISQAIVELEIVIGEKDNNFPFYIKAKEGAAFKWNEGITSADDFLRINAPALLIGYLRPIIATITSASPFNTYHIPFVDFTKKTD